MEFTNYDLYRQISLRPAIYKGTMVLFKVEFNNAKLYKTDMNISSALGFENGNTCYIRAKTIFADEKYSFIYLHMSGENLDDFIIRFGTEKITDSIIVEAEVVYETYSSSGDPYYNDAELTDTYKLIKII